MKKMLSTAAAWACLCLPISSFASPVILDPAMHCGMTSGAFFQELVQRNLINIKPYAVNEEASYFHPKFFKQMTAYGMHVTGVFGFVSDQIMFQRFPGAAREIYGVIVRESIANVQAQLNSMGATSASTQRIDSYSTAITCTGSY